MDRTLGIISVAKPLEPHIRSAYTLIIHAIDGGSPSLTGTATVGIELTTSNNAPPRFDQEEYSAELAENRPISTFIAAVRASCRSSVVYSIISGNNGSLFSINPSSGIVLAEARFDYEETLIFNLSVRATNIVGAYVETSLTVHITDINDNRPVFGHKEYTGNISEAAEPGSYVFDSNHSPLVIRAADADSNLNSLLIYSIVNQRAQDIFEIDPSTGALKTKVILDREAALLYRFEVQVTDLGSPRLSADIPARVTIYVDDVNDSPPVFTQQIYHATLLLPTHPDVAIIQVQAVDPDSSSVLEYAIESGDNVGNFHIDSATGILTIASNVEDMLDSYELAVSATDGKFVGRARVQIGVDFMQLSGLHFGADAYYAEIAEDLTEVRNIAVIHAVGHALNEHLTFSVLNPKNLFSIQPTSGVVHTTGSAFDRELTENYTIVIEVRDDRTPQRVAHTLLHVTVLDVNDNTPVFVNQPYFAIVSVDTPPGEIVKKV